MWFQIYFSHTTSTESVDPIDENNRVTIRFYIRIYGCLKVSEKKGGEIGTEYC